jgi:hypothetical protein
VPVGDIVDFVVPKKKFMDISDRKVELFVQRHQNHDLHDFWGLWEIVFLLHRKYIPFGRFFLTTKALRHKGYTKA